jgi:hypothetical protein
MIFSIAQGRCIFKATAEQIAAAAGARFAEATRRVKGRQA